MTLTVFYRCQFLLISSLVTSITSSSYKYEEFLSLTSAFFISYCLEVKKVNMKHISPKHYCLRWQCSRCVAIPDTFLGWFYNLRYFFVTCYYGFA